jgi:hypothetical protein
MTTDDPLQQNIRRTTAVHALKKIRSIVDEENADEAFKVRALGLLARYGWVLLFLIAVVFARLLGVI